MAKGIDGWLQMLAEELKVPQRTAQEIRHHKGDASHAKIV
jgi:hypothetical protein